MFKFFVEESQIIDEQVHIGGSDVNHIVNVVRLKTGDQIYVSDETGQDYLCEIRSMSQDEVLASIIKTMTGNNELSREVYLFQGLPKKDKLEWVIQKAVELGVHEVHPVMMKRSIVKLDDKSKVKKQQRWQTIAHTAAKQSKRSIEPVVKPATSFKLALESLRDMDIILVAYENAKGLKYTREVLSDVSSYGKIGVVVGPEGGFDDQEVEQLIEMGAKIISLGKRILRTETASLTMLSLLMLELEEDDHAS